MLDHPRLCSGPTSTRNTLLSGRTAQQGFRNRCKASPGPLLGRDRLKHRDRVRDRVPRPRTCGTRAVSAARMASCSAMAGALAACAARPDEDTTEAAGSRGGAPAAGRGGRGAASAAASARASPSASSAAGLNATLRCSSLVTHSRLRPRAGDLQDMRPSRCWHVRRRVAGHTWAPQWPQKWWVQS